MKKTHTKNMLSMAPTLNMFNKLNRQDKQNEVVNTTKHTNSNSNMILSNNISSSNNSNVKYNRSISSSYLVRKMPQQSPDKKFSGLALKSRPTLPKGMIDLHPYEKIIQILNYEINSKSQEQLCEDLLNRMESSIRILQQSAHNQSLARIFRQLKRYQCRFINQLLKITERQLNGYTQKFTTICVQYESRIKDMQKQTKNKIARQIIKGQSEIGRKIKQLNEKALFSTKLFNQMQFNNINVVAWVRQSQTLDQFIYNYDQTIQNMQNQQVDDSDFDSQEKQLLQKLISQRDKQLNNQGLAGVNTLQSPSRFIKNLKTFKNKQKNAKKQKQIDNGQKSTKSPKQKQEQPQKRSRKIISKQKQKLKQNEKLKQHPITQIQTQRLKSKPTQIEKQRQKQRQVSTQKQKKPQKLNKLLKRSKKYEQQFEHEFEPQNIIKLRSVVKKTQQVGKFNQGKQIQIDQTQRLNKSR